MILLLFSIFFVSICKESGANFPLQVSTRAVAAGPFPDGTIIQSAVTIMR